MEIYVLKRDGRKVPFDAEKIKTAVKRAFESVDGEITEYAKLKAEAIANYVFGKVEDSTEILDIEKIQDLVEHGLMSTKRKDVARAYILYREERTKVRNRNRTIIKTIKEKLQASNVQNQNANLDESSFGGRVGEASSALLRQLALDECLSEKARYNHLNNRIYIHDLDHYYIGDHNCLTCPIDDLLAKGFKTRQVDIRPANSINTAMQLVAVIFQIQSLCQFGGVSASHIDWSMVPYVRKSFWKHYKDGLQFIEMPRALSPMEQDDIAACLCSDYSDKPIEWENYKCRKEVYEYAMTMTTRELKQASEGLYHNLNSLQSRSGNQLPFSSLNFGTCTLMEGRMVIKSLLEACLNGVGKHHLTSIFPCVIFQSGKGINRYPGDPNYDLYKLALECTAKRLYPNYANIDWSINEGYDKNDPSTYVSTMGCRTYNGKDVNAEPGVNPQRKDGRGNICPVTIILPTLAMEAKEREGDVVENFMEILDDAIFDAKDMLLERYEHICSQDEKSARFMYENNTMYGYKPEEGIRSALKHGTLVIGQIGLSNTLEALIGCDHTTKDGMELAKRIEQLFKDRCAQFKRDLRLNFGVYYSPAENLCYTAMKKFKEKYGVIPNVSDRDYFTNSIHVPVWKEMSAFDKIDIEAQLTNYSNAGCICYVELPSGVKNNIDAVEQIVNYAMEKDLPYFAINVPNDSCLDCGYTDEFNDKCPECGSENIRQLRRVTGYLTGNYKTAFNIGKQHEAEDRVKHM